MTRLAIVVAIVAALLIGLVVALRVPAAEAWLEDLPGAGGVFEWLAETMHTRENRPIEVAYAFDHPLTSAELARARRLLAQNVRPLSIETRGDQLIVKAHTLAEADRAFIEISREPIRIYVVLYQSPELDRIGAALRKDEQAKKLGLTVALDTIGYHLEAPSGSMYVNPTWAATHQCAGYHIEGTGTSCPVGARDRISAYVRGDPALFVDAHNDLLTLPTGRSFYSEDNGNLYELESVPVIVQRRDLVQVHPSGASLDLTLAPAQADALAARITAPDTELAAEVWPGTLTPVTVTDKGRVSIDVPDASQLASELVLGGLGLHVVR